VAITTAASALRPRRRNCLYLREIHGEFWAKAREGGGLLSGKRTPDYGVAVTYSN